MNKTFVTGVYASGKTHFAKHYAADNSLPFYSFDDLHDYSIVGNQSRKILAGLPTAFVMDAIPIDENSKWTDFAEFEANNDVLVILVYCPDKTVWLDRVHRKPGVRASSGERSQGLFDRVKQNKRLRESVRSVPSLHKFARWSIRLTGGPPSTDKLDRIDDSTKHLENYHSFFTENMPHLDTFKNVKYYDSSTVEFTSRAVMLERINLPALALELNLRNAGPHYDWNYQDIELLGLVGTSQSYKTWEAIKDLVDWQGKKVVDLGCNHGYFSFKVADYGASAQGLDASVLVIETARKINNLRGSNVVFDEWNGGDVTPEADVILCLNVLHHFENPKRSLMNMRTDLAIFELKQEQEPIVAMYFEILQTVQSHRPGRAILLCKRKQQG